jgi:hypothetical protein
MTQNFYSEMGLIRNASTHKVEGITPEYLKKVIGHLTSPSFSYTRANTYGIAIYHKDDKSPTGVINVGGLPYEYEFLIERFQKFGSPLSPVEDKRTAY